MMLGGAEDLHVMVMLGFSLLPTFTIMFCSTVVHHIQRQLGEKWLSLLVIQYKCTFHLYCKKNKTGHADAKE